jgi:hypothetical protein
MPTARRLLKPSAALAAAALLFTQAALAGPPLICHPFVIESTPSLPWASAPGWRAPDRDYDVRRLTPDTLALLSPDVAIVARMETLRRATIYASGDSKAASDLLRALLARAQAPSREQRIAALAWFDAGYLIESYRQLALVDKVDLLAAYARSGAPGTAHLDGYALVEKAITATPSDAAGMEFAASLMTTDKAAAQRHRDNAAAGAAAGSLLAANIKTAWGG